MTMIQPIAAAIFCSLLSLGAGAAVAQTGPQITLSGQGQVMVEPDMARVTVGVTHEAKTATAAMAGMNDSLARVLDRLKSSGIDARDIQTGNLRLDQRYEAYDNGPRKPVGYIAASDFNVRVLDLDALGQVLDAVVSDGANSMRGLTFDVTDRAPHLTAARIAAVADARAKADTYAGAAGVALGDLIMISEGGVSASPIMMRSEASFDAGGVPVAAGQITISARVNIAWEIENTAAPAE